MDSITIDVGQNGITPSSTLSGGNVSPLIHIHGVNPEYEYACVLVYNKSGHEKDRCIWSIWNIPSVGYIPPGYDAGPAPQFPFPAVQGVNDFGENAWHGPNPGLGVRDRLLFQVFIRNEPLTIPYTSNADAVVEALRDGKTLAFGSLETFYQG
ncbi:MAG TPA: hypothetical protein O0X39_03440 [Methanocorpusculum sp.]|nr:hypothetical protein [Methanocorpusculum sp.]